MMHEGTMLTRSDDGRVPGLQYSTNSTDKRGESGARYSRPPLIKVRTYLRPGSGSPTRWLWGHEARTHQGFSGGQIGCWQPSHLGPDVGTQYVPELHPCTDRDTGSDPPIRQGYKLELRPVGR